MTTLVIFNERHQAHPAGATHRMAVLIGHQLKSGGYGLVAAPTGFACAGGTPGRDVTTSQEATVKICGVAVATPQG
jgi:hypothetical protein